MIEVTRATGEVIRIRYDVRENTTARGLREQDPAAFEQYVETAYDALLAAEQIAQATIARETNLAELRKNNTPYPPVFTGSSWNTITALIPLLEGTANWDRRYEIAWYVDRCVAAGFASTSDQMRLCAERYIAGKRKITPPGTARRKRDAIKMKRVLKDTPTALIAAVNDVIAEQQKAVTQYKNGVDKALNALVGGVMKRYKVDPAIIRELLIKKIG